MEHAVIASGNIHTPFQWIYANAASRTAATGFVSTDVNKLALQVDTETPYVVVSVSGGTPTWAAIGGGATAASSNPLVDGTAAPGTAGTFARGDHVHPTDTSRASASALTAEITRAESAEAAAVAAIPAASTTAPVVNGTAAAGTATPYARQDHIHPTDTSRAAVTALPAAASSAPVMDGTAAVGSSAAYARQDHIHPTDTSRAPLAKRVNGTTSAAAPAINVGTTDVYELTAQAANISSFTTNLTGTPGDEQPLMIRIKATAAWTIAWGASFVTDGNVALPSTTVSGKTIRVGFIYDSTSAKWLCVYASVVGY